MSQRSGRWALRKRLAEAYHRWDIQQSKLNDLPKTGTPQNIKNRAAAQIALDKAWVEMEKGWLASAVRGPDGKAI